MAKRRKNLLIITLVIASAFLFYVKANATGENIPLRAIETTPSKEIKKTPDIKKPVSSDIQLKGGIKIDNKEQLVSLTLAKSDIRQVLRMLADKSGKNIVIDESVTGEISLDLVNVTVNKVFEYIMTLKNLTYWQDGNTIIIATSDVAGTLGLNKTEIKPIKIKYVDAQKIADFLNSNIFTKSTNKPDISQSAIVTSNPSTNELYVFGTKNDYEMAKKLAVQLDKEIQVNTFSVNYTKPGEMAAKICMTVFQNTTATASAETTGVTSACSGTSSGGGSAGGTLTSFSAPSYNVMTDADLSLITIYGGTQEQINLTRQIIKSFDKKEQQVYLEISIIELSEDGSKTLTNAMTATTIAGQPLTYNKDDSKTTSLGYPFNFSKFALTRTDTLSGTLSYLITSGKGRLLSNPRIIAANNTESTINITEEYLVSVTTVTDDTTHKTTVAPKTDSTGITLSVTPKISPNGYVTLDMNPTYSAPKPALKLGDSSIGLKKERTFESKNVRVKDGETLVIAGLIQESENNTQSKVPILGDLPIIGTFFKNMDTLKNRSELIFMITPRIIKDDDVESI